MKLEICGEMKDVKLNGEFYIVKKDGEDYEIVSMKYEDAAKEIERCNLKKFNYRLVKREGTNEPFVIEYFDFGKKTAEETFATERSAMSMLLLNVKCVVRQILMRSDVDKLDAWPKRHGAEWHIATLRTLKKKSIASCR